MSSSPKLAVALVAVSVLAACGGGDGGSTGPGGGSTGMSAVIDGQAWSAVDLSIAALPVPGVPGSFVVTGAQTTGGNTRSIVLTFYNISTTGTYPLGVSTTVFGGIGQASSTANGSWITEGTGGDGTFTLTKLTPTRVAGTFSFIAVPGHSNPNGVGTVSVTQGKFDVPLQTNGTLPTVPDSRGSRATADLEGDSYNAADVFITMQGPIGFGFSSINAKQTVSLWLTGVTATGTYTLTNTAPLRTLSVGAPVSSGSPCCWGVTPADVGTITVTSITAARVKGTFNVTLGAQAGKPATTPLAVTGSFDVGTP
jgi:hypothetical protein